MKKNKKVLKRVFALLCSVIVLISALLVVPTSAADINVDKDLVTTALVGEPMYIRILQPWDSDNGPQTLYYLGLYYNIDYITDQDGDFEYRGFEWRDYSHNGFGYGYTMIYEKLYDNIYEDDRTGQYYNSLVFTVTVFNETYTKFDERDIMTSQVHYERTIGNNETTHEVSEAITINKSGKYTVMCELSFYNSGVIGHENLFRFQDINVESVNDIREYEYNRGVAVGYQDGYNNGVSATEKWSLYAFIDVLFTAPVHFVEEAFNFEIFGINMSNTIKAIFGLLAVLFVAIIIYKAVI